MMPTLLQTVQERLYYNPDTGIFVWRDFPGLCTKVRPGDVAGYPKDGYITITISFDSGPRKFQAHRLAWLCMTGEMPPSGVWIDHKNGIRSDNRWGNLRLATKAQNAMNSPVRSDNKSGHRGVFWHADRNNWRAEIKTNGFNRHLGSFDRLEDAVTARKAAEIELFGEYSFLSRTA